MARRNNAPRSSVLIPRAPSGRVATILAVLLLLAAGLAHGEAAKPADDTQGTSSAAAAQLRVKTRYGRHEGFQRLVFEWPSTIEYDLAEKDAAAQISFSRQGHYDLSPVATRLRRGGIDVATVTGSDGLTVEIRYPPGSRVRHYRSGPIVVIDVLDPRRPSDIPLPVPPGAKDGTADANAAAKPAATALAAPRPLEPSPPRPAIVGTDLQSPAAAATPAPTEDTERHGESAEAKTANAEEASGRDDPSAQPAADATIAAPEQDASRAADSFVLRLSWPTRVAAAAFRRGRHLWLVFSEPTALDLDALRARLTREIHAIEQIEDGDRTVLRLAADPRVNPALRLDGRTWIVDIGPRTMRPTSAIAVDPQPHASTGARLLLKAGAGESVIHVADSEIGDDLLVVPVDAPGQGVEAIREFAEFRLLPTSQGIVVEPHAAAVRVRTVSEGVEVTRGGGLHLSPAADRPAAGAAATDPAARIFDFAAWSVGAAGPRAASFVGAKQQLQSAVATASDADRNARRLALARYHFTYGMAAEALGVLRRIAEDDPEMLDQAAVRALRGAARFLTNDLQGAADDLLHPILDDQAEVALWRGALSATERNWRAAVAHFDRARGLLRYYPRPLMIRFGLLGAEAELAAGDVEQARAYLDLLSDTDLPRAARRELDFLRGRILEQTDEVDAAVEQWQQVADKGSGRSRVKAEVARIDLLRARGRLKDPRQAIAALDRLRFAWRGDAQEYAVLALLGRLQLDVGEHERGFDTLTQARRLFPGIARDQQLLQDMQKRFARLFLDGGADEMPPLQALALFQSFRELVPGGSDGDALIAKLADRLVAVDLLGQAAELLADQIARRLAGEERARVGARLALLYLLDRNPGEALNALEVTSVDDVSPPLAGQRQRLRARAFAALGRNVKALSLVIGDNSRDAELLRADVYWREQDWNSAAKVLSRLVAGIGEAGGDGKIAEGDARLVLRLAVALALSGDSDGLQSVRRRFDKAMDKSAYADAYRVVATEIDGATKLDYGSIVAKVAEVDRFQAFMASYRERLQAAGLSTIN